MGFEMWHLGVIASGRPEPILGRHPTKPIDPAGIDEAG
jgi:hypothetical protein